MRIYFDLTNSLGLLKWICKLACQNQNIIDLCDVGKLPGTPWSDARKVFPMNWRFFPMLDPQVLILPLWIFFCSKLGPP